MFFRRRKPVTYTFAQRVSMLREAGFSVQEREPESVLARRDGCAALVENSQPGPEIRQSGLVIGNQLARLTSLGYQTVWTTADGSRRPASAEQLKKYQAFLEDLRELLGLTSLYNESLGTTHAAHHYDRLVGRE